MKKVGVIVNPHAKKNRRMKKDAAEEFSRIGGEFADVRTTRDLDEVDKVIGDFKAAGVYCIGASGGDGSLHHVLSRIIKIYHPEPPPPFLILKGGTMNNISMTIGLKGDGFKILKRLRNRLEKDEPIQTYVRDTLRVKDKIGFIFGMGVVTTFLNQVYNQKEKGFVSNIKTLRDMFAEALMDPPEKKIFTSVKVRSRVDDKLLSFDEITALLIGTVEHTGHIAKLNFTPTRRATDQDLTMHAVISALSPRDLMRNIGKLRKGVAIKNERHFDGLIKTLRITSNEGADSPIPYTIDGDLYHSQGELLLEMGPQIELVYV